MVDFAKGVFAVTAHPDDEFVIAGLLRRLDNNGFPTTLMCLTCGGRIRNKDRVSSDYVKDVRTAELQASCQALGRTTLVWGSAKDGGSSEWNRERIVAEIVEAIRIHNPTIVITGDRLVSATHPDHMATHELTTEAYHRIAARANSKSSLLSLAYGFGLSKTNLHSIASNMPADNEKSQRILRLASTLPDDEELIVMELSDDELQAKLRVADCHKSQLPDDNGMYYGFPREVLPIVFRSETYRVGYPAELVNENPFAAISSP